MKQTMMRQAMAAAMAVAAVLMAAWPCPAQDTLEVVKVESLLVEKGADNCSLNVRVFVKNNGETATDAVINVVGVDQSGFEMEQVSVSGTLNPGQTKILPAMVKLPVETYNNIIKWQWKK